MTSHFNIKTGAKCAETRTHDYFYDPVFTLPTEKDQIKHAMIASMAKAQYEFSPIFRSMFSDLPNYPRHQIVIRKEPFVFQIKPNLQTNLEKPADPALQNLPVDIIGVDRIRFFSTPILTLSANIIPEFSSPLLKKNGKDVPVKTFNKKIQTMYRESSAQTSPWKPPDYVIMDGSDPEILKLNFLKENLPAGVHEVEIIKHARKKRIWEKLLPDIEDLASLEKRRLILEAIETDQWLFREQEITHIQNLRFELLEKMLQEILDISSNRTEQKLMNMANRLQNEREEKMSKVLRKKHREMRRLFKIQQGLNLHYHKMDVIDEFAHYNSEKYAPLLRFGEHPKRRHQIIEASSYEPALIAIEELSTQPRWLQSGKQIKEDDIKLPGRRLCIRETKWTEPVLKQLHEELKKLRVVTKVKCNLRKRIVKEEALDETTRVEGIQDSDKLEYDAVLMMQTLLRGRATQTLIYEGRDRCRELIKELQSTHCLIQADSENMKEKRLEVMKQQRYLQVSENKQLNIKRSLSKLQGAVVGTLLDFLNKELVRLLDERKAHALALIYERERRDKEAAEAGRRQVEERRRSEHDEMFKQVMKIHQETVDMYLRDIVLEGVEYVSEKEAKEYVKKLAEDIDENVNKVEPESFVEKEELIADLIHHFVLPEVERIGKREQIKKRQQRFLRAAHDSIYNKFEKLPDLSKEIIVNKCVDESSIKLELPKLPDDIIDDEPSNDSLKKISAVSKLSSDRIYTI